MNRRIIGMRAAVVALVATAAVSAYALSDEAVGTTFATYGIDLKIDSKTWYNGSLVPSSTWKLKDLVPGSDKFWDFDDIKPGDYGCTVISMHVKKTDAYMCLDFKNLGEDENGINEPESLVDLTPDDPELADGTNFFGWDDIDGDGKYEPPHEKILWNTGPASDVLNDTSYTIGDSKSGGICKENKTRYVGVCWCAGALTAQPGMNKSSGAAVCDPTTLGNEAQTDSFTVDVEVRAAPAKQNPNFICTPDEPPPSGGECKDFGFDTTIAKYEWDGSAWAVEVDPPLPLPSYFFSVTGDPQSVDWTANPAVAGVVVKSGGPGGGTTEEYPGGIAGTVDAWVPVPGPSGNKHDISHITFCANKDDPKPCKNCNGPVYIDIKNDSTVKSNTSSQSNTGGNYSGGSGGGKSGNGSGGKGGSSQQNNSKGLWNFSGFGWSW